MNRTAKVITWFELRSFQPHMQQMGDIIVQAAELMADAVPLLSSLGTQSGRLNRFAEEMIRLEEQADHLHDEGRKRSLATQCQDQCQNTASRFIGSVPSYQLD